jgi:hypothetical protein
MIGPLMIVLWAAAVFAIDRWVVGVPDLKEIGPPG